MFNKQKERIKNLETMDFENKRVIHNLSSRVRHLEESKPNLLSKEQLAKLIIDSVKKELQDTNKKFDALVDYLGCDMKKEKYINEVNLFEQFGNFLFGTPGMNKDTIDYKYTLVAKPKVKK